MFEREFVAQLTNHHSYNLFHNMDYALVCSPNRISAHRLRTYKTNNYLRQAQSNLKARLEKRFTISCPINVSTFRKENLKALAKFIWDMGDQGN
jgi:hypothetical protein